MKKLAIFALFIAATSFCLGDIHEPPKMKYTKMRKLGRGVSNIVYGWTEVPMTMHRWGENREQSAGIFTAGFLQGVQRAGARLKYGIYEVVNFHKPLYKDSYRPPYASINYLPMINNVGLEEFPPQIGELSTAGYTRGRSY